MVILAIRALHLELRFKIEVGVGVGTFLPTPTPTPPTIPSDSDFDSAALNISCNVYSAKLLELGVFLRTLSLLRNSGPQPSTPHSLSLKEIYIATSTCVVQIHSKVIKKDASSICHSDMYSLWVIDAYHFDCFLFGWWHAWPINYLESRW
jgi:hypothetical protein